MDNIIRQAVRESVEAVEPSASVRDSLLAEAARSVAQRSALGPPMPALVDSLCEPTEDDCGPVVHWPDSAAARGQWLLLVAPIYAVR